MTVYRQRTRGMRHILGVPEHDDDLDGLLGDLPDAPESWVAAAEEIPLLMQAAGRTAGARDEESLRAALVAVGLAPDADHVRALERILRRPCP
jgi:hypothetical protein